jgi:hypothetical protein
MFRIRGIKHGGFEITDELGVISTEFSEPDKKLILIDADTVVSDLIFEERAQDECEFRLIFPFYEVSIMFGRDSKQSILNAIGVATDDRFQS